MSTARAAVLLDGELRREGVVVSRALEALTLGPLSTADVADRAMGLRGNPKAAAAAVFTLLGSDSRFMVDGAGVWSLTSAPEPSGLELFEEEWVVVDVETTGGSAAHGHRVTEVAAVRMCGGIVKDVFCTLINPERPIPSMITSLTGISNEMVRSAPRFAEIAPALGDALRGGVFTAHNAAFDWGFVTAEMRRASGRRLAGRRLCTVRLARKLLPQLRSRSLDSLSVYFGLDIEARHRAADDALATATVLSRLIEMLDELGVRDWAGVQQLLSRRQPRAKRVAMPHSMESA